MKPVLIVMTHPDPDSFNAQIFQSIMDTFTSSDIPFLGVDLYREDFIPVMDKSELYRRYSMEPSVQQQIEIFEQCGDIILIYPEWWGMPPALMKGWLDQVLRPDVAYEYNVQSDHKGLCGDRRLIIFSTNNEGKDFIPLLNPVWQHSIGEFCGFKSVDYHPFIAMDAGGSKRKNEVLQIIQDEIKKLYSS